MFWNSLYIRIKSTIAENKDLRTNRHIIVIESDDWGSIRMSNKKDWDELLKMGYAVDKRPYERFDTLESAEDLEALFEVLSKHKNCNGHHPVITANMLMANPDFEKIEKSNYQEYYFESIANTYNRYYGNAKVLDLMRQGIDEGVFMPQSHGREHFNVAQWMKGLQSGDEDLLTAFKFGMCGIAPKAHPELGNQMMVALNVEDETAKQTVIKGLKEALELFEKLWGFKSSSFIAPCYTWDGYVEDMLVENGVSMLQGCRCQRLFDGVSQIPHYAGERKNGFVYNIRNCFFEPSVDHTVSAGKLMKQVDALFSKRKIVVISTHRINFVSGINEQNRKKTLQILGEFLTILLKKYPDVEFFSSDKLIEIYNK